MVHPELEPVTSGHSYITLPLHPLAWSESLRNLETPNWSRKILHLSWNPNGNRRVDQRTPLVHALEQMHPLHRPTTCCFDININVIITAWTQCNAAKVVGIVLIGRGAHRKEPQGGRRSLKWSTLEMVVTWVCIFRRFLSRTVLCDVYHFVVPHTVMLPCVTCIRITTAGSDC